MKIRGIYFTNDQVFQKTFVVDMTDTLNPSERSERMSRVRSSGNKSTEFVVETKLVEEGFKGWEKHPKGLLGKPDFYFPNYQLAIFVDGCFWHACPVCNRRKPVQHGDFWNKKIEENRKRDNRQRRKLRKEGFHVMRIWEHELKQNLWVKRLATMIRKIEHQKLP